MLQNPDKDCENYKRINSPNARRVVIDNTESENLIDIQEVQHETEKMFTCRQMKLRKQARYDYCLVCEGIL